METEDEIDFKTEGCSSPDNLTRKRKTSIPIVMKKKKQVKGVSGY